MRPVLVPHHFTRTVMTDKLDTHFFFSLKRNQPSQKGNHVWFKANPSPSDRKTKSWCDFRPFTAVTNSNFGYRITAARWKLWKVMQMRGIRILSQCHYMCLLRCTFSAMFKLNKTLNDCVVWHLINMFLFTSVPLVLKKIGCSSDKRLSPLIRNKWQITVNPMWCFLKLPSNIPLKTLLSTSSADLLPRKCYLTKPRQDVNTEAELQVARAFPARGLTGDHFVMGPPPACCDNQSLHLWAQHSAVGFYRMQIAPNGFNLETADNVSFTSLR